METGFESPFFVEEGLLKGRAILLRLRGLQTLSPYSPR
jgi:hypothetical protein